LATCWIGAFREQDIAMLLSLRPGLRPIAMLPLGWPTETPPRTPRRELNDLAREFKPPA
jgi:nitroreductase